MKFINIGAGILVFCLKVLNEKKKWFQVFRSRILIRVSKNMELDRNYLNPGSTKLILPILISETSLLHKMVLHGYDVGRSVDPVYISQILLELVHIYRPLSCVRIRERFPGSGRNPNLIGPGSATLVVHQFHVKVGLFQYLQTEKSL